MEPMYNPQNDVGSIKSGFTRNYSQDEVNALKSYVASHTGSMGSLVDRLTGAGIPLQDIATLTKAVGQNQGVAGMMSQMGKAPNTGVDMGGGYGGVATRQGPYTPSATNPGALAGLASQMPSRMPSNAQYMDDRIPRAPSYGPKPMRVDPFADAIPMTKPYQGTFDDAIPMPNRFPVDPFADAIPMPNRIPQSAMFDDPSQGYQNPGSSIAQMQNDLYPPQQPGFMTDPYRGDPIYPSYSVDPYSPDYNNNPMMPPRAPNDGISEEYYHGDPLGALMGQIQNDRVPRDQPIPIGEAMKRGGAVDISNHPTLVRMALSNRR